MTKVMSGEEESSLDVSEPETQFIPQENDEEELWEVIEITAEKGRQYKVKWAGVDPKTRKPWPESWVAKHDCTDDLVKTWKKTQALKKKRVAQRKSTKTKAPASKKSRPSATVRGSTASSSSTVKNVRSSNTTPVPGFSALNPHRKRKHSPHESVRSVNPASDFGSTIEPPPRKRRKLEVSTSDDEAEPVVKRALSHKAKQKTPEVIDVYEIDEGSETAPEGQAGVLEEERDQRENSQGSVTSTQRKVSMKKVKRRGVSDIANRSNSSQPDISSTFSSGHAPPKNHPPEPLFLVDHSNDKQPSPMHEQSPSPRVEQRDLSPELGLPVNNLSRLSPRAQAQLAEFDAFMERSGREPSPMHPHEEIDINHMYDEYMDFNPQDHKKSNDIARPTTEPLTDFVSLPTTSPPRQHRMSTEPLATSDGKVAHPMSSPLRSPKRVGNGRFPNGGSFREGVVPETETESSANTQSQSQPKLPPSVPQIIEPPAIDPTTTTPVRASLIRRMRPRTPGSANGSKLSLIDEANTYDPLNHDYDDGDGVQPGSSESQPIVPKNKPNTNGKFLRPLPVLSPSNFIEHLPHSSILNEPTDVGDLMSSIEQFSSSDDEGAELGARAKRKQRKNKGKRKIKAIQPEPEPEPGPGPEVMSEIQVQDGSITEDEDTIEMSVVKRGQKMAEAARKERAWERQLAGEPLGQRVSLVELLKANRAKARRKVAGRKALPDHHSKRRDKSSTPANEARPSTPKARTSSVPPSVRSLDTENNVRDIPELNTGDADVDADGEDEGVVDAIALREEEEESTQDIMADIANSGRRIDEVDVDVGWNISGSPEVQGTPEVQELSTDIGRPLDRDEPKEAPEDPISQTHNFMDDIDMEQPPEAPLQSPSPTSSKPRSISAPLNMYESQSVLPPTVSTRHDTPDVIQESISQNEPEHLGAAMTLLNTKSQEIARLDALLVAEQAKNENLSQEIEMLKAALVATTDQSRLSHDKFELELSESKSLLAQEKSDWEVERSKMAASVETLTREKTSIRADLEFFREQYAKASGFVSSVRSENNELEVRIRVAEEQTASGVAMVKATFEKHVQKLEDDAKHWKRVAMFIMEKDQRTNDDIRRRAGEEPELRARLAESEELYESLGFENLELEEQVKQKNETIQRLGDAIDIWKNEVTRLNVELNDAKNERHNNSERSQNDNEMVYRCQWRPEGGNNPCEGLFVSVEELRAHLFTGGHLPS